MTAEQLNDTSGGSLRAIMKLRDFRLYWSGGTISMIGDQFYFIALAWLVVILTDNVVVLGSILALGAVPRAVLIMIGGAFTDRFSPRSIMIISNAFQYILVAIMTVLIFIRLMEIWMLYIFALSFGIADAFSYPAQLAMIPRLVKKAHLQVANSLVQGMGSVSTLAGPVMAGLVIGKMEGSASQLTGVGFAFAIDALTFLVSMITLILMGEGIKKNANANESDILSSIKEAFVYVKADPGLSIILVLIVAGNFFLIGPLIVGIPIIAKVRLAEGAVAYGIVMTAYGAGALLGVISAGSIPKPKKGRFGPLIAFVVAASGIGMISLAYVSITWMVALVALTIGASLSFISVMLLTWIQMHIPEGMMGRIMSLFMFGSVGIAPVSMVVTGALMEINEVMMFVTAGVAMVVICTTILLAPVTWSMGFEEEIDLDHKEGIQSPSS